MLDFPNSPPPSVRQPVFNLPNVVTWSALVLLGIHLIRTQFLDANADFEVVMTFAFIPVRITHAATVAAALPGGEGAVVWTFFTYALLHADWSHVIFNVLWLAAFGSPLAWRFGTARFLAFSAAGAIGGALLHLVVHASEMVPMVGASAAISAHMAGAARFAFISGGPMGMPGRANPASWRRPAVSLMQALADRRVLSFLGVWFVLNLLFGVFGGGGALTSGTIAWEAHIGGFLVGLLLFPLFDPIPPRRG